MRRVIVAKAARPTVKGGSLPNVRAARWRHLRAMAIEAIGLLLLWELLGVTVGARSHILPTPFNVAQVIWTEHSVLTSALRTTVGEAAWGFVGGNLVAIILGVLSITSRSQLLFAYCRCRANFDHFVEGFAAPGDSCGDRRRIYYLGLDG